MSRTRPSKETRAVVIERDDGTCQWCGVKCVRETQPKSPDALTIDHIMPVSQGGGSWSGNLQVLCLACNTRKADGFRGTSYRIGERLSGSSRRQLFELVDHRKARRWA